MEGQAASNLPIRLATLQADGVELRMRVCHLLSVCSGSLSLGG